MATKITPISGFPEFQPAQQLAVARALDIIRAAFERFGYVPLETPAVERIEHLLAKGIAEKEVYGLRRLSAAEADEGAKDLALRFDLTVPLARYVAQHHNALAFPFRRYQMQPVWRGERPQAGRFRQFTQCDIDVIGDGQLSLDFDAEIPAVIFQIFRRLAVGKFTIRVNNRKILTGLFHHLGLADDKDVRAAVGIVDDLDKAGLGKVMDRLGELGLGTTGAERLVEFLNLKGDNAEMLAGLQAMSINATFEEGVAELRAVAEIAPVNIPGAYEDGELVTVANEQAAFAGHFRIDVSIARGLDYYTGTVYETRLDDHPGIGSICSGGRYDDLASVFVNRRFPGVGISIGLTRLMSRLFDAGLIEAKAATVAPVLVTMQDQDRRARYIDIANRIRQAGIPVEVYLEPKKLANQFKFADRKGFALVIVASAEELDGNMVVVRNMAYRQEKRVHIPQLVPFLRMQIPD